MLVPVMVAQTLQEQASRERCIALLSSYKTNPESAVETPFPEDLSKVKLEFFATGCHGTCAAFTMTLTRGKVEFDGHNFVKAKGKRQAKLSDQEFDSFVRGWYEGKFTAMREDYCTAACPDGTVIIVNDLPGSGIIFNSPKINHEVYSCFGWRDSGPITPKPPGAFFDFFERAMSLAKSKGWL
ncbi:MAG: DUF6438 domain-containing protein [Candidatus Korobacteraceae bacterium]